MTESRHDQEVRRQAEQYEKAGYRVRADLPGYTSPDTFGRKNPTRPDVQATRGNRTVVVEVETQRSKDTQHSRQQAETLRRSVAHRPNTTFKPVITRKGK